LLDTAVQVTAVVIGVSSIIASRQNKDFQGCERESGNRPALRSWCFGDTISTSIPVQRNYKQRLREPLSQRVVPLFFTCLLQLGEIAGNDPVHMHTQVCRHERDSRVVAEGIWDSDTECFAAGRSPCLGVQVNINILIAHDKPATFDFRATCRRCESTLLPSFPIRNRT
jgi:hypothetical protein